MAFLPLYFYFIGTSFLVSLTVYFMPRTRYSYLRLFPPFLLATLIAEFLGSYLWFMKKNNVALYNFFTVFEFCFYFWIISFIIRNKRMKKIIRITIPVYALTADR